MWARGSGRGESGGPDEDPAMGRSLASGPALEIGDTVAGQTIRMLRGCPAPVELRRRGLMVKSRVWTLGVVAFVAVATSGCRHLVHQHQLDGMMDPVNAQLAEHDGRLTTLESDVAGLQNDVAELRRRMDQLARDFGAHVSDEDMHCGCGLAVSLPVHFDLNSDEVRSVDQPILDAFASSVMQSYPNAELTVEGSTDSFGSAAANMALSRRRAENVRSYLISAGMNGDNVSVVGLGLTRLVNNDEGSQNPQSGIENRRVTFVLEWAGPGSTNN
jgi:outer membrane protein OmpA-like peptidoglycan-associated protein